MGRSTQEVTSYADGQGTFAQVVSDLSSAHPDGFVDAVWDGPDSRATLIEVHRSILSEARRAAGNQARYVVASDRPSAERRAQIEHEVVEQAATLIEGRHDVSAEVSPGAETVTIVLGGFDAASTADAGAGGDRAAPSRGHHASCGRQARAGDHLVRHQRPGVRIGRHLARHLLHGRSHGRTQRPGGHHRHGTLREYQFP
ncbi:hypothetical protein CYJ76_00780 [Kytococcus schroeteri]|uniref:Uncharacterized protein n=1 Tax=Kytococcus schroeteri TaxID=138300 RepID=A0A2I1PDW1_9MICO|nr:hypothetical protein [Kytococcus schroeteri]PKZ42817.1 hypothetical protein CYJ76_00780 [Kytococcus schroeteri]